MEFKVTDLEELVFVAEKILTAFPKTRIFALSGEMGSGKTAFVKKAAKVLGLTDTITSPTYAIVNEHSISEYESVFHIDLFRLNTLEEIMNLGIRDYLSSGNYCFIEWPEKILHLLPEETLCLSFSIDNDYSRKITVSYCNVESEK